VVDDPLYLAMSHHHAYGLDDIKDMKLNKRNEKKIRRHKTIHKYHNFLVAIKRGLRPEKSR
jgi:hypothetical protein